ncbi:MULTISPECIES: radical SAM/SPASM domain-containing protein [unclassified Afipia]|uniref:radical SAM/SPASM domain-containing protein n=2 Tax=Bacteria TaxID=2 RepID=UPI001360B39A|nr:MULTISPECIES: radical SAM/SPASM domain-containing protein [unclassified Afipia]|tara:strand:+ start:422 stop:1399 length:978 start_codon:yes stop_codon:yes gene_type:complete
MSQFTQAVKRLKLLRDISRNDGSISVTYQTVMIETTSTCNLDCPICPARRSENIIERANKQIKLEDVRRIVDLTRDMTESYCLNMWGEPLLHKEFREILEYVSSAGKRIWFSSNLNYSPRLAEMLTEFPLLNIICSLDGWDTESYAEYRWGGRFDVVRKNLAILAKGKCKIYPQYLVTPNDPEMELRKQRFVDFVKTVVGSTENVYFKNKQIDIRNDPGVIAPGRCSSMYAGLYFNSDGCLQPCCTNVRSDLFMGHISSFTSEQLINGQAVKSRRRDIRRDKNQFESCKSCAGEDHQKLILKTFATRFVELFVKQDRLPGTSKSL